MKTATVRQLRHNFGSVLNWVDEGEAVRISKRGRIIALISPPPLPGPARATKRPDLRSRLKRIYGNKILQGDVVAEERDSRPY